MNYKCRFDLEARAECIHCHNRLPTCKSAFSEELNRFKGQHGYGFVVLTKELGFPYSTVYNWINCIKFPHFNNLMIVMEILLRNTLHIIPEKCAIQLRRHDKSKPDITKGNV